MRSHHLSFAALFIYATLLARNPLTAQIPAFPGADGAARNVSGGRGGIVYHVTKLNSAIDDPHKDEFGTIRYGLNSANFPANTPRTIVFDVGGVFSLGRLPQTDWDPNGNGWDAQSRLSIGGSNVTLAGQTAPGTGVIFMGGGLKPQGNNNIVRNVTMAAGFGMRNWWDPGEAYPPQPVSGDVGVGHFPDATVYDGMDVSGTNLMIDHVSLLYSTDECLSMNEASNNITVQYSNLSQGLNYPQWDAEGGGYTGHALGSLLTAGNATAQAAISFHHNLYAHQKGRLPQLGDASGVTNSGAYYDFRNNVFYNWLGTAGTKSGNTFLNLVNNFYLAGNGGDNPSGVSIVQSGGGTSVISATSTIYRNGNLLDSNKDGDANDGANLSAGGAASALWKGGVATYLGTTDTANAAFQRVLNYLGANWWTRDTVINTPDERIINEARTGTGKIIAWADDPWNSDPNEGTEWRALKATPQTTRSADFDVEVIPVYSPIFPTIQIGTTIGDGMPSYWELQHGLDPNVADNNGDFDSDGYTNLEEYLNELAEWPAPGPIVFNAATNSRYAVITNWDANPSASFIDNWQPSKYDEAQINAGTVVVDAVGQHSGNLIVALASGNTATLNITGGWLKLEEGAVIGAVAGANGTLNLSGGRLVTPFLGKGPNGVASFTGGTLSADLVSFDLVNQGSIISPGTSLDPRVDVGTTWVMGDLTMQSGTITLELAGTAAGQFDRILIDDMLTAGGTLAVSLSSGFTPTLGDSFDLFDFTSATGSFALSLPGLAGNLAWDTSNLLTTGVLSVMVGENADFDADGDVDGLDFLVWQRGFGLTGQTDNSLGDANGDGDVDAADLGVWQNQYGSGAVVAASTAVPEPATIVLVVTGCAALALGRRK